ncbi:MAG: amidase [Synergistaceae bacterium]|jgi:Asp-tRNA(Asn)/Glu-tRNA(Gln) amidotransferase A subunit family amidase|nr:amidase [Clostridiaceae bacterium]NLX75668.1 amidase [Synergistaceae bacterium]
MNNFDLMEATIASVHAAMRAGNVTAEELISAYLDRIAAYEDAGPAINAIIMTNPQALTEAAELDRIFRETGEFSGPLHGIPVILKDNVETYDMPTTAGSKSLEGFIPDEDAFITKKLRQAGAIILAKSNLHEFAIWGETISSMLGQSVNPYDPERTPGGSSGGTGAAIATNIGIIGIGTDTINSIRSPASACSVVGLRPTVGLVSRAGIVPYSLTQDTAGPICRTVEDCVRTLDVIAGYDPDDEETAWSIGRQPETYLTYLKADGLKGKRLGVLRSFFGKESINQPVNKVMDGALAVFKEGGASLVELDDEIDSDWMIREVSVHFDDLKTHLNAYLAGLRADAPVHSVEEILECGKFHPGIEENLKKALSLDVGTAEYNQKLVRQAAMRTRFMKIMAEHELDALVYPHQQQLVCKIGDGQQQRNGVLCSATGFPSIAVPAGFAPSEKAPIGVPVGLEIAGRPFSEGLLIEIAYSFEQLSQFRKAPLSAPAL